MSLPFIKFISYTISYIVFIGILVASSNQFEIDESNRVKLSILHKKYFVNYTSYTKDKKLTYRFQASDMYLRSDTPTEIDIIICAWLIGIC